MTRLAATLLASASLSAAGAALADGYSDDQDAPFFYADAEKAPSAGKTPPAGPASGAPAAASAPRPKPPRENPIMETYPLGDAPENASPEAGRPRYLDEDCAPAGNMPEIGMISTGETADGDGDPADADLRRRGEMTGDDGVLEAVQDNPCARIHRRGGETPESARGYTHPDDIRRANLLEDRRIPVSEVGRYAPDDQAPWAADPDNPYVDSASRWTVRKGRMLSDVLTGWGGRAGYDVVWRAPHDYVVRADVTLRGTFPEAAGEVLESFANARPPLSGELYMANRVLVVETAAGFDGR